MSWMDDIFCTQKPIIAMIYLEALPGDPGYASKKGLSWVIERAFADLSALQDGGVTR